MKTEFLQIQQYLNIHPILKKNNSIKMKYVVLINYFIGKQIRSDLWGKQTYRLYCDKIVGEGLDIERKKTKDLSILEQYKFFKYRYFLLTDCLFIASFEDEMKGRKLLNSVIEFYGERYRKKVERVYQAFYSTEDKEFLHDFAEMKEVYRIIWNNRMFMVSHTKKIMITATMSAGKSTLINALVGKKVNKTKMETCTTKLHTIYNKAGEDKLTYELDHELVLDADLATLMDDNNQNETIEIFVGTRFNSIYEINKAICIIDTPGVNSARNKNDCKVARDAIKTMDYDILVYVINGEHIGANDDSVHLRYVKEVISDNREIIFLINKLDKFSKNEDLVSESIESTKKELDEKYGFKNPRVYPISAYAAYLAKKTIRGETLSEDEIYYMNGLARKLKKEDYSFEKYYPDKIAIKHKKNNATDLLVNSGILSLEKIIYEEV